MGSNPEPRTCGAGGSKGIKDGKGKKAKGRDEEEEAEEETYYDAMKKEMGDRAAKTKVQRCLESIHLPSWSGWCAACKDQKARYSTAGMSTSSVALHATSRGTKRQFSPWCTILCPAQAGLSC